MKDDGWSCFCSYLGLLAGDAVDGETSLHIVDQTEVLTSLLDADHIWRNKQEEVLVSKSNLYRSLTSSDSQLSWSANKCTENFSCQSRCWRCNSGLF